MNWKAVAADDLRSYQRIKLGLESSKTRLSTVKNAAREGKRYIRRRVDKANSPLIGTIVEADRLRRNIQTTETLTSLIERGLDSLTEEERQVLDLLYIEKKHLSPQQAAAKLGYEQRTLYRIRDRALLNFTLSMYGIELI